MAQRVIHLTTNQKTPSSTPGWLRETSALWASVVAQIAKNPPAMQEIEVQSLGWEDPLEKRTATHSSILAAMWEMQVRYLGQDMTENARTISDTPPPRTHV